jgi:hypothetical protein
MQEVRLKKGPRKTGLLLMCGLASNITFEPIFWRRKDDTQLLMYVVAKWN